jgi:hypothetical protein
MRFLKYPSSEALGQVPGGSGLGVNAEDHGVLANGMADGVEKGEQYNLKSDEFFVFF